MVLVLTKLIIIIHFTRVHLLPKLTQNKNQGESNETRIAVANERAHDLLK